MLRKANDIYERPHRSRPLMGREVQWHIHLKHITVAILCKYNYVYFSCEFILNCNYDLSLDD